MFEPLALALRWLGHPLGSNISFELPAAAGLFAFIGVYFAAVEALTLKTSGDAPQESPRP